MADISAERFNRLRQRVVNIVNNVDYGSNPNTGLPVGGYGQNYTINSAVVGGVIGATEHRQLYAAIAAARVHQIGSLPSTLNPVDATDIVGEDETKRLSNGNIVTDDVLAGYDDIEAEITLAETALANDIHALGSRSQFDIISTTRNNVWGNSATGQSIDCEFQVDFGSIANARRFFNTGGEIRITGQHAPVSTAKDTSWNTIFKNFSYYLKSRGSAGTAAQVNTGWSGLTNSYSQVGYYSNPAGGVYAENYVRVSAKVDQATNTNGGSRYLYIKVEAVDADTGDGQNLGYNPAIGTDESVSAGTVIVLSEYRATSGTISAPVPVTGINAAAPTVTFLNGNNL